MRKTQFPGGGIVQKAIKSVNNKLLPEAGTEKGTTKQARWERRDYAVVTLAVLAATITDAALVKIPQDTKFLGKVSAGSPVTGWLKGHSDWAHKTFGKRFEEWAKVPFDFAHHKAVEGLRPKTHRLMSPGHDLLLGLFYGIRDLMKGQATLIDKNGVQVLLSSEQDPLGFTAAVVRWLAHLLSDVFTTMGLPVPGFSALTTVQATSPFKLRPDGDLVAWKDVARWMYTNGFDLRHFLTQGLTPATVELVVRGYWLLEHYGKEVTEEDKNKLEAMLLVAHGLTLSRNLLKIALTRNPLHFNAAEFSAVVGRLMAVTFKHGYSKLISSWQQSAEPKHDGEGSFSPTTQKLNELLSLNDFETQALTGRSG